MLLYIGIKQSDSSQATFLYNSVSRVLGMTIILLMFVTVMQGQPSGYYDPAAGLTGTALQKALHDIIVDHIVCEYSDLWIHFQSTDKKGDGTVWDMYSDIPSGTSAYIYYFNQNECGNYTKEGDCFNREHSFPKSWFGGEILPMYTDLFHLYPTDGWVNNKRGNFPFGTTASPTWISTNGSKLGPCSYTGYSETIFEPINSYKGDFARSYFYMATRYYGEDSSWPGSPMTDGSQPKPWALNMLLEWNQADPVSQKETERNEAVFAIQGNRNPFIDNPAYTGLIWGSPSAADEITGDTDRVRLWPNPADDLITLEVPFRYGDEYDVRMVNVSGSTLMEFSVSGRPVSIDVSGLQVGFYILLVSGREEVQAVSLVISR